MRDRLQNLVAIVLALTSIAVGVVLVHREFFATPVARSVTEASGPPVFLPGWREMLRDGVLVGSQDAKVKIVEFADLECPVCKRFDHVLRSAQEARASEVALVFVHFPLAQHRFARAAARAAECANEMGRFGEFIARVYDKQDSIGLKSWSSYGSESGIQDTARFTRCASDTVTVGRIEAGMALGHRLGVRGTPTVIVNGWRFASLPDETQLRSTINDLIAGRQPF